MLIVSVAGATSKESGGSRYDSWTSSTLWRTEMPIERNSNVENHRKCMVNARIYGNDNVVGCVIITYDDMVRSWINSFIQICQSRHIMGIVVCKIPTILIYYDGNTTLSHAFWSKAVYLFNLFLIHIICSTRNCEIWRYSQGRYNIPQYCNMHMRPAYPWSQYLTQGSCLRL